MRPDSHPHADALFRTDPVMPNLHRLLTSETRIDDVHQYASRYRFLIQCPIRLKNSVIANRVSPAAKILW
jgi:hypothetical protein